VPTLDIVTTPDTHPEVQSVIVVIDVLRATTMIAALLDAGANFVWPVRSIEKARHLRIEHPELMIAGERSGLRPEGFDMGNSPAEITSSTVRGRGIVLTTTNGTAALETARHMSETVLTLSLTNLASVEHWLSNTDRDACLMCSGTDGHRSLEDELAAGLLAARMSGWDLTSRAICVREQALQLVERWGGVAGAVAQSPHAARLVELGFDRDVDACSRVSVTDCVPALDSVRGVLFRG